MKAKVFIADNAFLEISGVFEFQYPPRIGETIQFTELGEYFHDGFPCEVTSVYHNLAEGIIEIFADTPYTSWDSPQDSIDDFKGIGFSVVRVRQAAPAPGRAR